jgi:hypothetical protein
MPFSLTVAIADVEKEVKTVVGWFAKVYSVLYKDEPTLVQIVDSTVSYVEIGLPIVLGVTGGAALDGPIDNILNEVVSDLKVVSATIYDFGASPTAASVLAGVQAQIASLESAANITNPATKAKLQLIINAVGSLYQLVLKAVASVTAPAA